MAKYSRLCIWLSPCSLRPSRPHLHQRPYASTAHSNSNMYACCWAHTSLRVPPIIQSGQAARRRPSSPWLFSIRSQPHTALARPAAPLVLPRSRFQAPYTSRRRRARSRASGTGAASCTRRRSPPMELLRAAEGETRGLCSSQEKAWKGAAAVGAGAGASAAVLARDGVGKDGVGAPSSSFARRCVGLVKEKRARLYIARRCVTMLACWRDKS